MNSTVLEKWFMDIIVPWATALEGRKAIFVDNCSAHFSEAVLKECERLNIAFIPLPPNATWLCQPCDVALFKSLKTAWKESVGDFNEGRKAEGLKPCETLPRANFCEVLDMTINRMNHGGNNLARLIFTAFSKTGICPLNRTPVLAVLPTLASSEGNAFQDACDEVRSVVSSGSSDRLLSAFVDSSRPPSASSRGGSRPLGVAGVPLTMAVHK
jgi:hypothetical protein